MPGLLLHLVVGCYNRKMKYNEAVDELSLHSFFLLEDEQKLSDDDKKRLDYALCRLEFYQEPADWKFYYDRILECLEIINKKWNGVNPDEIPYGNKEQLLERKVILAIQRILHTLNKLSDSGKIKNEEQKLAIRRFEYVLSELWLSVLEGGDFENINEEAEAIAWIWDSESENTAANKLQ